MKYISTGWWIIAFLIISPSWVLAQAEDEVPRQLSAFEIYIHAKCKEVEENGKTTDRLKKKDLADLPVGIAREVGNTQFIIAIDSAYRADRGGWFFSAYASILFPGSSEPIAFAAKDIGFNKGGLTSSSNMKLWLVSRKKIPINDNLYLELPADGHNFIEFDCDGFKSVNLKGNFVFSSDLLTPDPLLAQNETEVTAAFEINTGDLNNIMTSVTMTPFKIKGIDDLSFVVKNAVADFSDIVNPAGFIFPQDYQQSFGEDLTLWRGFYLQELSVGVKGFVDEEGNVRKIQAKNLLIDDMGVSGLFSMPNFLSLDKGSADGWPLSVDHITVQLMFSKVRGGELRGKIGIPFLGEEPVDYTAQMEQLGDQLNYRFSITTGEGKKFETPLGAIITLDKGSIIALEQIDGRFIPSTSLHGMVSVKKGELEVDKIRFENLGLTSQEPYITSGTFSLVGEVQAKSVGFSVRIDSIDFGVYHGQAALGFGVALNFMEPEDKGFGASTYVQLLAKMEEVKAAPTSDIRAEPTVRQKWEFDKVKINDVILKSNTQAFTLDGRLTLFNDDPTYGNGFRGNLEFSIKKVLEKGIKVNAYFGSKETYRYWHVDAFVPTSNIPIIPPIFLNGIMGGASYKMVRQQPLLPDFSQLGSGAGKNLATGNSTGQHTYVPDEKAGLSFMAGVTLVVANENAINADVMLEVAFNQGGGIKYAQFNGSAFFMSSIADRGRVQGENVPAAPVYASLNMLYDNDNDVFHANMKTYINIAGVIQGVGPNGLVGEAVIHVDRNDWYTYIGRPSQMFGLNIAGIATANTYFMLGTQIENLPLPPKEVREIFGDIDLRLMRDDIAAAGGGGFAAGVHFKIGFDSEDKLKPFYIAMMVGAGTDFMLRDYGDAQCVGRSGKIGIDGWYASGQAYVFLKGKVGIRVKERNFDIVSLGLAALLQAKLPNPTWMKGQVAGNYKVMGGLVKGKFHLSFTIGDECEMINQGSEIDNIEVIADLKPDTGGGEVNVFTAPQVSFNTAIDTDFSMMDLNNNLNSYRVKLEEFKLEKSNQKIPASLTWNESKDVAVLKTSEILPQNTNLTVSVKIYWEKKGSNGMWEKMKDDAGKIIFEEKSTTFTTGKAPNFIPEENVAYSYPIKSQHNLYINEAGQGYVQLDFGQEYLFPQQEGSVTWEYIARFKDNKGHINDLPLTYSASESRAKFAFPAPFEKQAIYSLTFIKKPVGTRTVDKNLKREEIAIEGGDGSEVNITSNSLEGSITQNTEKSIYSTIFRTSQYATFGEKWTSLGHIDDAFDVAKGSVAVIGKHLSTQEVFDEFELAGSDKIDPLVYISASPDNHWLKNIISPLLYDHYDESMKIEWRDPLLLGVKPLKGVKLTTSLGKFKLTDAEVSMGRAYNKSGTVLVAYYLSYYAYWDYNELINKASAKYLDNWSSRPEGVKRLLASTGYTDLLEGDYPVDITYSLPGANKPSYSNQIKINF